MNTLDYTHWVERAFLHVEGVLLQRSVRESPTRISEATIQESLIDGMKNAKESRAVDVRAHGDVPWNRSPDIINASRVFGQGSAKQHDVVVQRGGLPMEVAIEIKWLKNNASDEILMDLWRLVLTHGTAKKEKDSCRTFMLIGGLKSSFQETIAALRDRGVVLRWSPQGQPEHWPPPSTVSLGRLANKTDGQTALLKSLRRRPDYHRTPPEVWWNVRCSVVARSWKTIRGAEWKIALWEIDHRATCGWHTVDWTPLRGILP